MGGNPEKLKKVGHSTVYRTDKSEEDKEELEEKVIGDGGEDFIIVPVVYPPGKVSVSPLGYFLPAASSSKNYHHFFPVSLGAQHIQYFSIIRGGKTKIY